MDPKTKSKRRPREWAYLDPQVCRYCRRVFYNRQRQYLHHLRRHQVRIRRYWYGYKRTTRLMRLVARNGRKQPNGANTQSIRKLDAMPSTNQKDRQRERPDSIFGSAVTSAEPVVMSTSTKKQKSTGECHHILQIWHAFGVKYYSCQKRWWRWRWRWRWRRRRRCWYWCWCSGGVGAVVVVMLVVV